MKIIKLQAQNVKRIKAVEISPDGNIVKVEGKNGSGKTSVLDSILYALGGKGAFAQIPIREGEERALIKLDLGDIKVTRVLRKYENGEVKTTLKVENAEGYQASSPQQLLNKKIGAMSFDPMAFTRMDAKKRLKILKEISRVDTCDIDQDIDILEGRRKNEKIKLKSEEVQLSRIKVDDLHDVEPLEQINADIMKIETIKALHTEKENRAKSLKAQYQKCDTDQFQINDEISRMRKKLAELEQKLKTIEQYKKDLQQEYKKNEEAQLPHLKNMGELLEKQAKALFNLEVQKQQAHKMKVSKNVDSLKHKVQSLDHDIAKKRQERKDMIAGAKYPIDGMLVGDEDIIYNGIPFEQISTAEKIKLSLSMAISLNPEIRIIRIMDGSLCDDVTMEAIKELAQEHDFQVWLECVSSEKGDDDAFYIEEGELR